MARFCGNCGFPLGANVTFCSQCGAKQQEAGVPAAAAPTAPPAAPAPAASGSGLKIVLVVMACLGFFALLIIGGAYYAVHKVKQTVTEKAAKYGIDLSSIAPSSVSSRPAHLLKPCEYLSAQDASNLLGEPIERTAPMDGGCLYFGPPGLAQKLGRASISSMMQRVQAQGGDPAHGTLDATLNQLAGSLGAATGQTENGGEAPLLTLVVGGDGKTQMAALMANQALFGGITRGASDGKETFGTNIAGLGDKAISLPALGLNVLRGDVIVRVVPGPVPDADTKSIEIARMVLRHL
jgi:hypothetical protein